MDQERAPESAIVVGAGMVGLSTAWFLQEHGVRVTVVDRVGVAAGSSWGNAGWLAPALTLPLPDPAILASGVKAALRSSSPVYVPLSANRQLLRFLVGLARHSTAARWRSAMSVFAEANRLAPDAFDAITTGGVLEPIREARPLIAAFASAEDRAALVRELEHVAQVGDRADHELVGADVLHELEPALAGVVTHGVLLHGQRFINPGRFVRALSHEVRARGGEVLDGLDVDAVERVRGRLEVRAVDGGVIDADAVVIASGTWLGQLARSHGVRTIVQAGRGYSFTVRPQQMPTHPIYFPVQRVAGTPLGGVGRPDGFRIAGMMEFRRPKAPPDPRRIRAIVDAVRPLLRDVDWESRSAEWVGSRPCTADGLPLVGPTCTPGVHVAGGHGMWGMALGPLTGKLLAAQIARGETSDLLEDLDPLR